MSGHLPDSSPAGNGGAFSSAKDADNISGFRSAPGAPEPSTPSGGGGAAGGAPGAIAGLSGGPSIARSADEFQRAHDLMVDILLNPAVREAVGVTEYSLIAAAADVLCWALGHKHNQTFGDNLARLERSLNEAGFEICDLGRLENR